MRVFFCGLFALNMLVASLSAQAGNRQHIAIAAAADTHFAMDAMVASYQRLHPGAAIDVVYGSSGKLLTQIEQGAPFELFFSADSNYPRQLVTDGKAAGAPVPYALGSIVLWSAVIDMHHVQLTDLVQPRFGRIAIANPQHAPYGKRAEQALRAAGLWDQLQQRLVYGENIAQAAQFALSGNARVGIISRAQTAEPAMARGSYVEVPPATYQPLRQSFVLTRRGAGNALAQDFARYVQSGQAREILLRSGFGLPAGARGR